MIKTKLDRTNLNKTLFRALKKHFWLIELLILFIFYYSLITIVKHNRFETNAFDLGLYDQVVWRLSRFQAPYSSIKGMLVFGDHFHPILFFFAPLYWIWSDPRMLLIAQAVLVVLSVIPVYLIGLDKFKKQNSGTPAKADRKSSLFSLDWSTFGGRGQVVALVLSFVYLTFIGIQNALDFDFHMATISIFPLSFLTLFLYKKRWGAYWIFFLLSLMCKEDMAPILFMIGIYEILIEKERKIGFLTSVFSLFWFYFSIFKIMPIFCPKVAGYIDFLELGNSPQEMITNVFFNPIKTLGLFFNPFVKVETFLTIIFSFAGLALFSPFFLICSLSIWVARFFSSSPLRWELGFHYSVNIAPILAIGAIRGLSNLWKYYAKLGLEKFNQIILVACLIFMVIFNLKGILNYETLIYKSFQRDFYVRDKSIDEGFEILALIPQNASISAQSPFVPHLSHRNEIYLYPHEVERVEYLLLSLDRNTYPLHYHQMKEEIKKLRKNEDYQLIGQKGNTFLFARLRERP